MCVQCMMGAMSAGAAASGARSWLATRRWPWLTPVRLRRATVGLLGVALLGSATVISGSSATPGARAATPAPHVAPAHGSR